MSMYFVWWVGHSIRSVFRWRKGTRQKTWKEKTRTFRVLSEEEYSWVTTTIDSLRFWASPRSIRCSSRGISCRKASRRYKVFTGVSWGVSEWQRYVNMMWIIGRTNRVVTRNGECTLDRWTASKSWDDRRIDAMFWWGWLGVKFFVSWELLNDYVNKHTTCFSLVIWKYLP